MKKSAKKFAIFLSAFALAFFLSSCDIPSSYQGKPPRDMVIGGKPYKVTNVRLCEDTTSCYVWIVYPEDGTGSTYVQSETVWKHSENVQTIIVP